ncbi:hypothetical protein JCM10295v2_003853 [Rhodotorula toruloides]
MEPPDGATDATSAPRGAFSCFHKSLEPHEQGRAEDARAGEGRWLVVLLGLAIIVANYRHLSTPVWAKTAEERLIAVLFWNAGLMPPVEEIGKFPKLRKIIYEDDFIRIVDRTAALEDAMHKHLKRKTGFWASFASRGVRADGSDLP